MRGVRFNYAQFGSGNNTRLVKYVLLTRPWWSISEQDQSFNLKWQMYAPYPKAFNELTPGTQIYSHLPNFKCLHSKLSYYQLLTRYFPSECFRFVMPTYLFQGAEKGRFSRHFAYLAGKWQPGAADELTEEEKSTDPCLFRENLWILKPLSLNRGRGIVVVNNIEDAERHVRECEHIRITEVLSIQDIANAGGQSQWLIQKYIEDPLLINGRKFDIRVYALALDNGDCYIYKTGYLRLSGAPFSLKSTDLAVHLTNNAVQQYIETYQSFEEGNMLSFDEFQEYLKGKADFYGSIWPRMQQLMARIMEVASLKLIQRAQCKGCFELFGFDFMIDAAFNPWAIEVNSNPCLELSSAVSWSILPYLLDDMFELTIDKSFPPPQEVLDIFKQRMATCDQIEAPTLQQLRETGAEDRRIVGLKWQCLYCDKAARRKNGFIQAVRHFKRCRDFQTDV